METVEILKAAREKLAKPGAWTKGCTGRNAEGEYVGARDDEACQWCAYGAVLAVMPPGQPAGMVVNALNAVVPPDSEGFVSFNDEAETVEPVLALFDRAIAACVKP